MNRLIFSSLCGILTILLFSCSGNKSNSTKDKVNINSDLQKEMVEYYKTQYINDSMAFEKSDTLITLQLTIKDTAQHFYLKGNEVYDVYSDNGKQNKLKFDSTSVVVTEMGDGTIYLRNKQQNFLYGDIDGDGKDEIIYSVSIEGVGGGNHWWNEIIVFKLIDDKYKIVNCVGSSEFIGANQFNDSSLFGGNFYPEKISSGLIIGKAYCWGGEDPHCCPSVKFLVTVKFVNNHLVFNDRKFLEKVTMERYRTQQKDPYEKDPYD